MSLDHLPSIKRPKLSPITKLAQRQRRQTIEQCPVVFQEPFQGPKVLTYGKSIAQQSRQQYFNARLNDLEKIRISLDDTNIKSLVPNREKQRSNQAVIDSLHRKFRSRTRTTLKAINQSGIFD